MRRVHLDVRDQQSIDTAVDRVIDRRTIDVISTMPLCFPPRLLLKVNGLIFKPRDVNVSGPLFMMQSVKAHD